MEPRARNHDDNGARLMEPMPSHNPVRSPAAYADGEPAGISGSWLLGVPIVQTTQPRDVAALALVVGVFLVLFIVVVVLGSPTR